MKRKRESTAGSQVGHGDDDRSRDDRSRSQGLPVDAYGSPAIDPTANVIALSEAGNKRQDDLRAVERLLLEEKIRRVEQIALHVKEMEELRARYARQAREAESSRLDAQRQVDVLARDTAADRALVAIQTLAVTTQANADTLRSMVSSTATTIAAQTATSMSTVNDRLASLERSSYEGSGRGRGLNAGWGYLATAVGLLATIVALFAAFGK